MLLVVPGVLRGELASPNPPSTAFLVFAVLVFGWGLAVFTGWFFAIPALILFNVSTRSRRARYGKKALEWSVAYLIVTATAIGALFFVQATYPTP